MMPYISEFDFISFAMVGDECDPERLDGSPQTNRSELKI